MEFVAINAAWLARKESSFLGSAIAIIILGCSKVSSSLGRSVPLPAHLEIVNIHAANQGYADRIR